MKTKNYCDESLQSDTNKMPILNLTNFSENVICEMNKIRSNPHEYLKKLNKLAKFTDDSELEYNGTTIKLKEKMRSFSEAIDFLEKQDKIGKLTPKKGILKCGEDLMQVLILRDGIENTEELVTNCNFLKRMNKYGCAFGKIQELINFGSISPELIVFKLLISDGNPSRTQRKILFNAKMQFIGVTSELLPCEKYATIISMAEHYFDVGEDIPDVLLRIYHPEMFRKLDHENNIKSMRSKGNQNNENTHQIFNNTDFGGKKNQNSHCVSQANNEYPNHKTENNKNFNNTTNESNLRTSGVIKLKKNPNIEDEEDDEEENEEFGQDDDETVYDDINNNNRKEDILPKNDRNHDKNKDFGKKNDLFTEDAEEIYDENILKVKILEKEVTDEKTSLKKILVKKSIIYKDGSTQSTIYIKNK